MEARAPRSELVRRIDAVRSQPPLSSASADDIRELNELLAYVEQLDDLPGKWQAAIIAAELGVDGRCCH